MAQKLAFRHLRAIQYRIRCRSRFRRTFLFALQAESSLVRSLLARVRADSQVPTLEMNDLVEMHSDIMDKYDPKKKVALVVDEWGGWYAPLPGSNPGFLAQQNSLREAVLAALNLNIFARRADRVRMANIAQMINVLQAMILTDEKKMVLTPTYYVYKNVRTVPRRHLRAGHFRQRHVHAR